MSWRLGRTVLQDFWEDADGSSWDTNKWPTRQTLGTTSVIDVQGGRGATAAGTGLTDYARCMSNLVVPQDFELSVDWYLSNKPGDARTVLGWRVIAASWQAGNNVARPAAGYNIELYPSGSNVVHRYDATTLNSTSSFNPSTGDTVGLKVRQIGSAYWVKYWNRTTTAEPDWVWSGRDLTAPPRQDSPSAVTLAAAGPSDANTNHSRWENLVVREIVGRPRRRGVRG